VLVPGLVNGHQHSHEHFHKGRLENLPLELWMHYVRAPRPVKLTPRQVYLRTLIGALESLRSGATTLVDDVSLGQAIDPETVEAIFQAYEDAGIRALVGFSMMDRAIVDNFPGVDTIFPPDLLAQLRAQPRPSPDAFFSLLQSQLARHHPQHDRVGLAIAPSAPQRSPTRMHCLSSSMYRRPACRSSRHKPSMANLWSCALMNWVFYGREPR
jgi:5-methylthioadenosine/S-adenosylhomocysteine deaminase